MADLLNGLYWEMGAYRVHFPTGACFHLPSTLKQQKHRIKFANQMQLFTLVMNIEHLNKLTGISWNSLSSASFTNAFITHNSHHVFIIHSVFTADSKLHFYILQFAHKTIVYSRYNEISCRTNRNETKKIHHCRLWYQIPARFGVLCAVVAGTDKCKSHEYVN